VKIGKLLDAEPEKVALDAAKRVLGIAGIKPANESQISVSIDLKAGYVISIEERDERPMKIISPELLTPDDK
jgi:hypothetical protein